MDIGNSKNYLGITSNYPINRCIHLGLLQLGTVSPLFINCLHKPLIIHTLGEFHIVDLEIRLYYFVFFPSDVLAIWDRLFIRGDFLVLLLE